MQTSYRVMIVLLAVPALLACGAAGVISAAPARADAVVYPVDVTVQPGDNLTTAADALAYAHGICDRIAQGRGDADVMGRGQLPIPQPLIAGRTP
jgi:hypothetical protein